MARCRRDAALIQSLVAWFARTRRDLPWRAVDPATGRRDPYRVLVSEVMLQQTRVSRVLEKFGPFLACFPNVASLASAELPDVLSRWSGLGYYSRARHLHAAARRIVECHAGVVPDTAASLRTLAGVGRYTAGAVASFAFGRPEPIVDGNAARVLVRVRGRDVAPGTAALNWAWAQAGTLARTAESLGIVAEFNESLMELGATVCLPRNPRCETCPASPHCTARRRGVQNALPRPRPAPARKRLSALVAIIRDAKGRVLLERRPEKGLWAGLWQPPTLLYEHGKMPPTRRPVGGVALTRRLGGFETGLSHRDILFVVRAPPRPVSAASARSLVTRTRGGADLRWAGVNELAGLGISNAHRKALEIGGFPRPPAPKPVAS